MRVTVHTHAAIALKSRLVTAIRKIGDSIKRRWLRCNIEYIPAFVILLQSDEERCIHVYSHLIRDMPFCNVVWAIEKNEVGSFLEKEQIVVPETLPLGKLACSASHIKVWNEIIIRQLPYAIVFEDDVSIRPGFISFIHELIKQIPSDFDLVHLYVSDPDGKWAKRACAANRTYLSYIPSWGRSAYLVSYSGAEKLVSGFKTITDFGDRQITTMARQGHLKVYCAGKAYVDNWGQLVAEFEGERLRSTVW